jgi:K+-transporting ATPase ATPase C chain
MRHSFFSAIRFSLLLLVVCAGVYTALVWVVAQFSPRQGAIDQMNIGQKFDRDHYFWSRPSNGNYAADASGGSNKSPGNEAYLAVVRARIDSFMVHHPGVDRSSIPADLVTASGSGLDPHISPAAAQVQVTRVARARGLSESVVKELVTQHTTKPLIGLFGPFCVNVVKLNHELDNIADSNGG